MNENFLKLIQKYRSKGILLDTNLLLLYLVGSLDPHLISSFPRTANYSYEDFERLEYFFEYFPRKITTPHILTEVSNLLGRRSDISSALRSFIEIADEVSLMGRQMINFDEFSVFGITDIGVLSLSDQFLVLTDDGPLFGLISQKFSSVVNLETLRHII